MNEQRNCKVSVARWCNRHREVSVYMQGMRFRVSVRMQGMPFRVSVHMQGMPIMDSGRRTVCQWERQNALSCFSNMQGTQIQQNLRQCKDASQSLMNQYCSWNLTLPPSSPHPPVSPCANHISIASSRHLTSSLKLSQAAASAFCPSQT